MVLVIIFVLVLCSDACAYIDPGTSGMFVGGSVWIIIVTFFSIIGAFAVKFFFRPIKRFFLFLWHKIKGTR